MDLQRRSRRSPLRRLQLEEKTDQVTGWLIVRRIPELNQKSDDGQGTLFDAHRSHAFFTTSTLDTVTADKTHRGPAIIEQVHADLKNSAIAPLPPRQVHRKRRLVGVGDHRLQPHLRRRHLHRQHPGQSEHRNHQPETDINLAARISSPARRITLHLPRDWPWESQWTTLFTQHPRTAEQLNHLTI